MRRSMASPSFRSVGMCSLCFGAVLTSTAYTHRADKRTLNLGAELHVPQRTLFTAALDGQSQWQRASGCCGESVTGEWMLHRICWRLAGGVQSRRSNEDDGAARGGERSEERRVGE